MSKYVIRSYKLGVQIHYVLMSCYIQHTKNMILLLKYPNLHPTKKVMVQVAIKLADLKNWNFWIVFNPFIPAFLKMNLPFLNLDMCTDANRCFTLKS